MPRGLAGEVGETPHRRPHEKRAVHETLHGAGMGVGSQGKARRPVNVSLGTVGSVPSMSLLRITRA